MEEEGSYCVLCQDDHVMSDLCVLISAQCKSCGEKGHLKKDCPLISSEHQITEGPGHPDIYKNYELEYPQTPSKKLKIFCQNQHLESSSHSSSSVLSKTDTEAKDSNRRSGTQSNWEEAIIEQLPYIVEANVSSTDISQPCISEVFDSNKNVLNSPNDDENANSRSVLEMSKACEPDEASTANVNEVVNKAFETVAGNKNVALVNIGLKSEANASCEYYEEFEGIVKVDPEQVVILSESDSEPEETGTCQTGQEGLLEKGNPGSKLMRKYLQLKSQVRNNLEKASPFVDPGLSNQTSNQANCQGLQAVPFTRGKESWHQIALRNFHLKSRIKTTKDVVSSCVSVEPNQANYPSQGFQALSATTASLPRQSASDKHPRASTSSSPDMLYWQLKSDSKVICPACNITSTHCTYVNSKNIYNHLFKIHCSKKSKDNLLNIGRFCPRCNNSVRPIELCDHMKICAKTRPQPQSGITPPPPTAPKIKLLRIASSLTNPRQSAATSRWRIASHPPSCRTPSNNDRFASSLILPGLSVVEGRSQTSGTLKTVLGSYLLDNFAPFRGEEVNCLGMYKHYQKTMLSQGQKEVVSPARFVVLVTELSEEHWKISVKPQEVELIEDNILGILAASDSHHQLCFQGIEFH